MVHKCSNTFVSNVEIFDYIQRRVSTRIYRDKKRKMFFIRVTTMLTFCSYPITSQRLMQFAQFATRVQLWRMHFARLRSRSEFIYFPSLSFLPALIATKELGRVITIWFDTWKFRSGNLTFTVSRVISLGLLFLASHDPTLSLLKAATRAILKLVLQMLSRAHNVAIRAEKLRDSACRATPHC